MLDKCELCPRKCGTDRISGKTGYCGAGIQAQVFRFGPHFGEEPPISGSKGSGTVFFSRCTMRCIYCQNFNWSQNDSGKKYDKDGLSGILEHLKAEGCHNWNLVSPTPWLPMIEEAADAVRKKGHILPFVYNTSGFERPESLERYKSLADIYLTDLRYAKSSSAAEGSDAPIYVETARVALKKMWDLTGAIETDDAGIAVHGTICRILVLPGRADEAIDNLRWIAKDIGTDISLSLMAQYHPVYKARDINGWDQRVQADEYRKVCDVMNDLGFENGWIQEWEAEVDRDMAGFHMKEGAGPVKKLKTTGD